MRSADKVMHDAARVLPEDVLNLIATYHLEIWAAEHKRYRQVIDELQRAIYKVRRDHWTQLMDWESGGYGHLLEGEQIDDELDWSVQRPRHLLGHVLNPKPDPFYFVGA